MRSPHDYVALERDDFAAGTPLGFDLYDLGGAALLPAGTTLHDPAQHAFLFDHFRPAKKGDVAAPARPSFGDAQTGDALGLSTSATIGIRRRVGATRTMHRCRLIGRGAGQSLFVEPQHAAAFEFARGDDVEAIAIGRAAVVRFAATVEAVHDEPAPFMVLSAPGFVERLRTRAEPRVPVRIAARCSGGQDGVGSFGIVRDMSLSGLSIATSDALASAGDPLRIRLPYEVGGNVALLPLDGTVRNVHADPAAPGFVLHHVAYGDMETADTVRLKALLFDRLMALADAGSAG
ncbi:PilZ domain-containing protein [Burkholderia sp. MR1-5-21]